MSGPTPLHQVADVEATQQRYVKVAALGLELLFGLGQGFLLDQTLVYQAGDPLEAFLELRLYGVKITVPSSLTDRLEVS